MEGREYIEKTYWVRIYISGPLEMIEQCCREFVLDGLCVTVTPTKYIFTHGEETGVVVELINYPVYPTMDNDIWRTATELADFLLDNTHQGSYTVMDPTKTYTFDRRAVVKTK